MKEKQFNKKLNMLNQINVRSEKHEKYHKIVAT